jgi:hypothetical protein
VLAGAEAAGLLVPLAEPWLDLGIDDSGVTVKTTKATERFDAVLFGTGFDVDMARAAETRGLRGQPQGVGRRPAAGGSRGQSRGGSLSYLGPGFELLERCRAARRSSPTFICSTGAASSARALGRRHPRPVRRLAAAVPGDFA